MLVIMYFGTGWHLVYGCNLKKSRLCPFYLFIYVRVVINLISPVEFDTILICVSLIPLNYFSFLIAVEMKRKYPP